MLALILAIGLTFSGDYESSEFLLKNSNLPNKPLVNYYRLVNNFSLNNKEECKKILKEFENVFDLSIPDRHKALIYLMGEDLKFWKDDLGDIARDMKKVQDRLNLARGGLKTQKYQKEIIDKLDKLIAEAEKSKQDQSEKEKAEKEKAEQSNPLQDSKPQNIAGPGIVDNKKLQNLQRVWGKLPEKEREIAILNYTKDMPPRYRHVIEEYFKLLSR